jgi:hypothetical protein
VENWAAKSCSGSKRRIKNVNKQENAQKAFEIKHRAV